MRKLFWDTNARSLRWDRHREAIIGRVLATGTWTDVTWLRKTIGDPDLREWILRHEGRGLTPQQLRFWQLLLDLPRREVDRWLQSESRQVWDRRTGPYRDRSLAPLAFWPEPGCPLAEFEDFACMKLSAISQRGSRKDFVDLFALGRHGFSLQQMLDWYREKFEVDDIAHLLYALVYFDDADAEPRPSMIWKVSWREVKETLRGWARTVKK
ncbi:MAG TPA: nucleotidyl transferase AbiEii/AbiGii toxin family protein [Thermoanaerobaculia bacterium]|nr:nucleotidyl transferase AbiEii/AbiGii toxin family protein [Thermoanaerobaculia bacterium]